MLTRLKEEVAKAQRNEERMWGMMLQRNKEQQAVVKAIVDGAGAMTELCEVVPRWMQRDWGEEIEMRGKKREEETEL